MLFRKKGRIREQLNDQLLLTLNDCKEQWYQQKHLIDRSIDPSQEVICQLKMAELKYLFLLKEAKRHKITLK